MEKNYQAIVIGAGPAGCSAAISLGLRGFEVLLLEKSAFPRDKVCGDGISPPALEVLERLGVLPAVLEQRPWKAEGVDLFAPSGQRVTAPFSHLQGPHPYGLVMPRKKFDALLWQRARTTPGVHALENCEVRDLLFGEGGVRGVRAVRENRVEEWYGGALIAADGIYSPAVRKMFPRRRIFQGGAFGIRAYFEGVKHLTRRIEIHCGRSLLPGYGWVFPVGEEAANVGVGISSRQMRKKDLRRLFRAFVEEDPLLRDRFGEARMVEHSLQGCPISNAPFFRRRFRRNVLLAGDAGEFSDIVTGEGIYFSLRSGECAAEAVEAARGGDGKDGGVGRIYERLWRKALGSREFLIAALVRKLIVREFFLNRNIGRAARKPAMARDLASILCHQKSKIRLLF